MDFNDNFIKRSEGMLIEKTDTEIIVWEIKQRHPKDSVKIVSHCRTYIVPINMENIRCRCGYIIK
jgi:hypothetical protein